MKNFTLRVAGTRQEKAISRYVIDKPPLLLSVNNDSRKTSRSAGF